MPGFKLSLHWPCICACLLIWPPLPCQAFEYDTGRNNVCETAEFSEYWVTSNMVITDGTGAYVMMTSELATVLEDTISPEIESILGFPPTCPPRLSYFKDDKPTASSNDSATLIIQLRGQNPRTIIKAKEDLQRNYSQGTVQFFGQTYSIDYQNWSTDAEDEDHATTLGPAIAIPVFFFFVACGFIICCRSALMRCYGVKVVQNPNGGPGTLRLDSKRNWPTGSGNGAVNGYDPAVWKAVQLGKATPEMSNPTAYPTTPGYPQVAPAAQAPSASPYPAYPAPYPPHPAYPATNPSASISAYPAASAYPTPAAPVYSTPQPQFPPAPQQPAPHPSAYPPPPPASQYPPV